MVVYNLVSLVLSGLAVVISVLAFLHSRQLLNPIIAFEVDLRHGMYHESMGGCEFHLSIQNRGKRIIEVNYPLGFKIYSTKGHVVLEKTGVQFKAEEFGFPRELLPDKYINMVVPQYEVIREMGSLKGEYKIQFVIPDTFDRRYRTKKVSMVFDGKNIERESDAV